ncbi:MAG: esterase family protein [Clostridia bacterium]|jgi:S-formylglutathione hydrolase FrmB|nr:esterase family protein [Clostridia bacterium]
MAFIQCSYYSEILGFTTNINVCLPQDLPNKRGGYAVPPDGFPTLYLLHGLGDDHTIWSRKCAIDRYAATHGIAVVMPFGARSFYADMVYGSPYYSYISKELINTCETFFPLSKDPAKRFIGGLSMGGYGAFKIALSNPDQFKAAFSLSGPLDIARIPDYQHLLDLSYDVKLAFGDISTLEERPHNLFKLAEETSGLDTKPSLYMCCGTEDFLYPDNESFKKHLDKIGYDAVYHKGSGGHDFSYWDNEVQLALEWLSKQQGGKINESN